MRITVPWPIDTSRLADELRVEFGLASIPAISVRNPQGGIEGEAVLPDSMDRARAEAVLAAQPNADEVAADRSANESTIRQRADAALQANRDFLALASPTNAQTLAQVKALTRQNNGLIRLILNRLDGTD